MNSSHADADGHATVSARSPFPLPAETHSRIRLPKPQGPSLDAIACVVVAAHEARLFADSSPQSDSVSAASVSDADLDSAFAPDSDQESAAIEPTLRLDAKQLKREHKRLHAGYARGMAFGSGRHLALTGGAAMLSAALAISLLLWLRPRALFPTASSANNVTAKTGTKTPAFLPSGASSLASARLPVVSTPLPRVARHAKTIALSSAARIHSPAVKSSRVDSHNVSDGRELPLRRKPHSRKIVETDGIAARRRGPSASPVHASAGQPRHDGRDEDTFATHSQARRSETADEWTDRLP